MAGYLLFLRLTELNRDLLSNTYDRHFLIAPPCVIGLRADKAESLKAAKELFPGHRVTVVLKEGEPGT